MHRIVYRLRRLACQPHHDWRRDGGRIMVAAVAAGTAAVSFTLLSLKRNDAVDASDTTFDSWVRSMQRLAATTPITGPVQCETATKSSSQPKQRLKRNRTFDKLKQVASQDTIEDRYTVRWSEPLGEGTFGAVYQGLEKATGDPVAIKKMPKSCTDSQTFQREMEALLRLRDAGGHPNICGLRENFDQGEFFYLVLDLIQGGEMFEQLVSHGAYSEADAARLVREIASALAFLHGIGIVHGDMKPENVMLSSSSSSDATIQVVDFGTAQVHDEISSLPRRRRKPKRKRPGSLTITPSYAAPEILQMKKDKKLEVIEPSFDMWALGVILYIMLTGAHPFDLYGQATDGQVIERILSGKAPPLRNVSITSHLSSDAISVIEHLLQWNPKKRWTAAQLLANPWVTGETASQNKITGSDTRLSAYRKLKTKIGSVVFKDMLAHAKDHGEDAKRRDLIENAFKNLDADDDGYLTAGELKKLAKGESIKWDDEQLTLSDFYDLLSDNMKNRYYPAGHVIYKEGEIGDTMYFLNAGSVEITTKEGFHVVLAEPGSFFGEGALLDPTRIRSGSIKCLTPVHAIEVSREYFEKFLAADLGMHQDLRTTHNSRRHERVRKILDDSGLLSPRKYQNGEKIFNTGDVAEDVFVLDDGHVDISVDNKHMVYSVEAGSMFGESSLLFKQQVRNASATCTSQSCTALALKADEFLSLMGSNFKVRDFIHEIAIRREFQKAICAATNKPFPRNADELRTTFDFFVSKETGALELANLKKILLDYNSNYTDQDVHNLLDDLDLQNTGAVEWEEFKALFEMEE